MYEYVTKREQKAATERSEYILHQLQLRLSDYFTFDIRLIGSGDKRLITRNGPNGPFDLDYNLILQKDKKKLISKPQKIKEVFLTELQRIYSSYGFKSPKNSTSVITSDVVKNNQIKFSLDIAIMHQGNNGNLYKLVFDKRSNTYIWNEVEKSRNYAKKFKEIKTKGYWNEFKKRYLELKNKHLSNQTKIGSYSIFLKTLNEIHDKVR